MALKEDQKGSRYIDKVYFVCHKQVKRRGKRVKCDKRITIRKGTCLERSRLTLRDMMCYVLEWVTGSTSFRGQREGNFSSFTARIWNAFCQDVVIDDIMRIKIQIGGPGKTVEVDESKFGKRKYNRGHYVEGQWVFGGVERGSSRSFMVPVEKRDSATLMQLILEWILPGTTIITDGWKAYNALDELDYQHLVVNHSICFVNKETGAHTNTVEGYWGHVKRSLPQYNRRKNRYMGYLAKYIFTKKIKFANKDCVEEFFRAAGRMDKAKVIDVDDEIYGDDEGLLEDTGEDNEE